MPNPYRMTISRLTIDKLGVRLYDRVSAVIAELIANSYDADATIVTVEAPMGQFLATKTAGKVEDKGLEIIVSDNGIGMTPDEVNAFYLKVGAERRNDTGKGRGDKSEKYNRKVMGRKGVGKLAPFGICEEIEVLTSGGKKVEVLATEKSDKKSGYRTAHLILDRTKIVNDTDDKYFPEVGHQDGTLSPKCGTIIRLRKFSSYRRVNDHQSFVRQLAQRFGIQSNDWKIVTRNSEKEEAEGNEKIVGSFDIETMENSRIEFKGPHSPTLRIRNSDNYRVIGPENRPIDSLMAGFASDDYFYPITGWVAYARKPYMDELMAGIRIYCRGKIAAQTAVFNRKAGFPGEHNIRSYLVGEIHADWLDESEDLIQTDRRDILWSHELGQALEEWGKAVINKIGKIARDPMRKTMLERFFAVGKVRERIQAEFPSDSQNAIRETAEKVAGMFGRSIRGGEVNDEGVVNSMVQLSLNLAPHITLHEELRAAADKTESTVSTINQILKTARVAELSSFGTIAEDRLGVIGRLQSLIADPDAVEQNFQGLLEDAPWLINPEWSPVTQNQTFNTIIEKFRKLYGESSIKPEAVQNKEKRPDFVLLNQDNRVQIVEIKNQGHKLINPEMDRIIEYYMAMKDLLISNIQDDSLYKEPRITVVCDGIQLSGSREIAFEAYCRDGILTRVSWTTFLMRTRRVHQEFLDEAARQRRIVGAE